MPIETVTEKLRRLHKRIGSWAFARYCRNQGFRLEYTLHVMFPQKYNGVHCD